MWSKIKTHDSILKPKQKRCSGLKKTLGQILKSDYAKLKKCMELEHTIYNDCLQI